MTMFDRVVAEKPEPLSLHITLIPHVLDQLTLLALHYYNSDYSQLLVIETNQTVLRLIGQSYPALISLNANGFCITSKDIFRLIAGEGTDILYPVTGHVKNQDKELTIKRYCNLKAKYPNWTWATFLPLSKSIKSDCFLGDCAPCFERNWAH